MTPLLLPLLPSLGAVGLLAISLLALPWWLALAPQPEAVAPPTHGPAPTGQEMVLVRSRHGLWFVDGTPVLTPTLQARLRDRGPALRITLLPSAQLSAAEVSVSMAWLRRHSGASIRLHLQGG